ncbi:MAG TPA: hypothetical protein VJ961_10135 [Mariprofundaceae bacterium]|nr:hypothetical protein [Mariprofundaceae bacterium]
MKRVEYTARNSNDLTGLLVAMGVAAITFATIISIYAGYLANPYA